MLYGVNASGARTVGGGSGYSAGAVHFAGGIQSEGPTYLSCASLAATDNGLFSMSFWENGLFAAGNKYAVAWVVDPSSNYDPNLEISARFLMAANSLEMVFTVGGSNIDAQIFDFPTTGWNHILCSIDTNQSAGNKIFSLYVNDTLISNSAGSNSVDDSGAAFASVFNGKQFVFGDDGGGSAGPTADFADVWIAPGVKLHDGTNTIPAATRRQFITSGLKPANPSGFPASAILFTGDSSTFATNAGTGGTFTLTGSLSNASTSP